jgi:hypothetical protein
VSDSASTPGRMDARALASSRREALRRRTRRIRRSVAALAVTLFGLVFAIVYVQLASGHDPGLAASAARRRAALVTGKSDATGVSSGTAGSTSSGSSASESATSSSEPSTSASEGTSTSEPSTSTSESGSSTSESSSSTSTGSEEEASSGASAVRTSQS